MVGKSPPDTNRADLDRTILYPTKEGEEDYSSTMELGLATEYLNDQGFGNAERASRQPDPPSQATPSFHSRSKPPPTRNPTDLHTHKRANQASSRVQFLSPLCVPDRVT